MSSAVRMQRRTWLLFLAGSAVLVLAMVAVSAALLRQEAEERAHEDTRLREQAVRIARSDMDAWFAPIFARESGRHHSDYSAYRSPRRVFDQNLQRLPAGSVLEPSPLLGFQADTIALHLQWSPGAGLSSPQVPLGRERELALASGLPAEALAEAEERLSAAGAAIDFPALVETVRAWSQPLPPPSALAMTEGQCASPDEQRESDAGPGLVEDAGSAAVGRTWPMNLEGGPLVLARQVALAEELALQVVLLDREALEGYLLAAAATPGLELVPGDAAGGLGLMTLPYLVQGEPQLLPQAAGWTPLRTRLTFGWLAGLACLGAAGWSLRQGLADSERRARFAAAVSHELRTPLTTLQLYSDMLADGVITDEQARQEYLDTIRAESARLASLVENVLLHARVERQGPPELSRIAIGELLEAIEPVLRRRADEAGRPLEVTVGLDPTTEVEVDRAAVERVLFNLVDNACKHAAEAADPTLQLEVGRRGSFVDLQVSDRGPGVPRALASAVFEAFQRGEEKGAPGAGLGLSLSRELARELRGELSLVPSDEGACFRLSLRLA